ncbi:hypothetical protein BUALT_Bualt04G0093900 [Buddleja alternifolia]|uniref:Uncharacterized protein n=1 Tax=Buddleja alternifolia TaxID=168488 RepID=A0AAV6XMI7_9LAMI|nr:hypothetical protein BUALT_Bualt04G0093900 [Buddleja alternifolia]
MLINPKVQDRRRRNYACGRGKLNQHDLATVEANANTNELDIVISSQNNSIDVAPEQFDNNRKNVRRPTCMPKVWGQLPDNLVAVSFNDRGQPNDKYQISTLAHFLGTIARNGRYCPLNYKDWRLMPHSYKDEMLTIFKSQRSYEKIMGEDKHRHVRMYGMAVTRVDVYGEIPNRDASHRMTMEYKNKYLEAVVKYDVLLKKLENLSAIVHWKAQSGQPNCENIPLALPNNQRSSGPTSRSIRIWVALDENED